MKRLLILLFAMMCIYELNAKPLFDREWMFEYLPGWSYVPNMPLSLYQEGLPKISMTAQYRTRSFEMPIYYSYRLTTWKDNTGWSIEMNHLKIYLKNITPEVSDFSVSHGYNQIMLNRHLIKRRYTLIYGGGIVLGHPESIVRNQYWEEKGGLWNRGYYLAGLSGQFGFRIPVLSTNRFLIPAEFKITAGYGHVPISNGHAQVPIVSVAFLTGAGIKF